MKKFITYSILFGILGFGFRHVVRPFARGGAKVLHKAYKVTV